jgi:peptidoglycan/LPS O-acetylase OafA/YrhL
MPPPLRDHVIDFWRGASVLMVITHHLFDRPYLPFYSVIERIGPLGVQFFFVISGYIITSLLLKEERATQTVSIKNFYIRRLFRIGPALLGYMAFLAFLNILHWADTPDVYSAVFACSFIPCSWNVAHTWSLGIEEMFYAVWPLLFLYFPKYRTQLLASLLAVFIPLMSLNVLIFQGGHSDLPSSFACIAIGALYAVNMRFHSFVDRWGLPAAFAALLLVLFVPFRHLLLRDLTPFLILIIITTTYRLTWLTSSLPFNVLANVGLISYSLYLYQQVFASPQHYYPSSLAPLMFAFAFASYRFLEQPAIALGKRLQLAVKAHSYTIPSHDG